MRPSKARFVTACQQLLALGAVLAVLAPAATVISLDVVVTRPGDRRISVADQPTLESRPPVTSAPAPADQADQSDQSDRAEQADPDDQARVEVEPVEPEVTEVAITPEEPADEAHESKVVSRAEPVSGYGAVGVTWSGDEEVADDDITVLARTRTGDTWSAWTPIEYHDEHGPDPDSPEGAQVRPGTDPLLVGHVDEVQTKVVTTDGVEVPSDMRMAVIAPGDSVDSEIEEPAIDTADLDGEDHPAGELETSEGAIELQAGSYTRKPRIFSRAQWGANERMRDGSPNYYEVHAGFVHHTVNANDYSRDEVPGIIRSIYAYHTQSRGWSDVGYNFLVDKFGRIWEGRYGGVDRPVVGAHTLGYNEYSFAMSAIGNFETARPGSAMLDAYGRLFAWKLSLHGIDAASTSQRVGSRTFAAVNGHRDAGSTACPGRYLYARIPAIRTLAAQYQADWTGRDLATDVAATSYPDLLVRRGSDQRAFVLPTDGLLRFRGTTAAGTSFDNYDVVVASPDLTSDGTADLVVRNRDGYAGVRPGDGAGGFGPTIKVSQRFAGLDQVAAVGDLTADGRNDLVARDPVSGDLLLMRGGGGGGFRKLLLDADWAGYTLTAGTGDVDGDGLADVISRSADGRLWLHPGTGRVALGAPVALGGTRWNSFDVVTGYGDLTGDGRPDLVARHATSRRTYVYPVRPGGRLGHRFGPFGSGGRLASLTAVQVTGSADADLVGVRSGALAIARHGGTHSTLPMVPLGSSFRDANRVFNVGDWDRDGFNDLMARDTAGTMRLIRGLGNDTFANPVILAGDFGDVNLLAAVGDTTGDGYPDLMGQPSGRAMRIYPGRGTHGFRSSYVAHGAIGSRQQLGLGRWNGDGAPDNLFRVGDRLQWYRGNGPGGLTGGAGSLSSVDLAPYDWVVSPGDLTRDGRTDLVVRQRRNGYLWVLPGTTSGFGRRIFLAEGFGGYDLAG